MIDSNFIKNSKLSTQNVSRETLDELNKYSLSILKKNKEINLISSSTEKSIKTRHILDSAQTIDFINKNDVKICADLGSGAGLPGIVLAILMKPKKAFLKNSARDLYWQRFQEFDGKTTQDSIINLCYHVGQIVGLTDDQLSKGLQTFKPQNQRLQKSSINK